MARGDSARISCSLDDFLCLIWLGRRFLFNAADVSRYASEVLAALYLSDVVFVGLAQRACELEACSICQRAASCCDCFPSSCHDLIMSEDDAPDPSSCLLARKQDAVAALQEGKAEAVQLEKLRADATRMRLAMPSQIACEGPVREVWNQATSRLPTVRTTCIIHGIWGWDLRAGTCRNHWRLLGSASPVKAQVSFVSGLWPLLGRVCGNAGPQVSAARMGSGAIPNMRTARTNEPIHGPL